MQSFAEFLLVGESQTRRGVGADVFLVSIECRTESSMTAGHFTLLRPRWATPDLEQALSVLRSIMETLVRPFLVLVFLGMTMTSRCDAVEAWVEIAQRIESQRAGIVSGKATASGVETDLDGNVLPVKMAWLFDDSQSAFAFIRTCPAIESHDKESTFGVWSFADRRLFYTNHDGIPTVAVEQPNEKRRKTRVSWLFGPTAFWVDTPFRLL